MSVMVKIARRRSGLGVGQGSGRIRESANTQVPSAHKHMCNSPPTANHQAEETWWGLPFGYIRLADAHTHTHTFPTLTLMFLTASPPALRNG